jgi:hypothetical protein
MVRSASLRSAVLIAPESFQHRVMPTTLPRQRTPAGALLRVTRPSRLCAAPRRIGLALLPMRTSSPALAGSEKAQSRQAFPQRTSLSRYVTMRADGGRRPGVRLARR